MQGFIEFCAQYSHWVQLLSLATGLVFMVMQVFQHRWMWYFGIATSTAAMLVTLCNFTADGLWAPLWAQVMLNVYFLSMDIVGIFSWKKIESHTDAKVHVIVLPRKHILIYGACGLVGAPLLCLLFSLTNDPDPIAEGLSFTMSIIAQIMLTRSYMEQWYMWIAADLLAISIYAGQGAWWMVALYYAYTANACLGIYYWRQHATYLRDGGANPF